MNLGFPGLGGLGRLTRLRGGGGGMKRGGKGKENKNARGAREEHSLFKHPQYGHLRIKRGGQVDCAGGKGVWARFVLIEVDPPQPDSKESRSGPATMRTMTIAVPAGLKPGQELRFFTPCGQEMRTTVPNQLPANRQMNVQYPSASASASPPPSDAKYVCMRSVGNTDNWLSVGASAALSGRGKPMMGESIFRIRKSLGNTKIFHVQSGRYLRVVNGSTVVSVAEASQATDFQLSVVMGRSDMGANARKRMLNNQDAKMPMVPPHRECKFSREELIFFRDNGYVVARNAISTEILSDALRVINRAIENGHHGGRDVVVDGLKSDGEGKFEPTVRSDPAIAALFRKSKVWALLESIVGRDKIIVPGGCQIALRYPLAQKDPEPLPRHRWHCDGMGVGSVLLFSSMSKC
uniref:Uncharacterized protein n=1 Tax=Lotharella globosa TaxID=91324 RepID=A0A6V3L3M4_9EUKA